MAVAITDANSNGQPFLYGNTVTNLVAPVNQTLTNFINALELDGEELYWFPLYAEMPPRRPIQYCRAIILPIILRTLTYNVTNIQGQLQVFVKPTNNYVGPVTIVFLCELPTPNWIVYLRLFTHFRDLHTPTTR